jgi:hypothetical protein
MSAIEKARKKTRFVLELRNEAMPLFLDVRGRIVADVYPSIRKQFPHWQAEAGQVLFADRADRPKNQIVLGIRRSLVALEDASSLEEFTGLAEKVLQLAFPTMESGWRSLERVGIRFMEVATTPKATYDATRAHLLATFHKTPLDLPLEHTDSQAILVHKYGRYSIGPTRRKDDWLSTVFTEPDTNVPEIGVAIDIDSFAKGLDSKTADELLGHVRDVLTLTTTVEGSLFVAAGVVNG